MDRYRKKPVVIEAMRWEPEGDDCGGAVVGWLMSRAVDFQIVAGKAVELPTLEGTMRADPGDWIIKGVKGEFYPCKPDIFEATYEPEGVSV